MTTTENDLINGRYAIEKAISADGYIIAITESVHPIGGRSYNFEMERLLGDYFPLIDGICKQYDLSFMITAKDNHPVLSIS